VALVSLWSHGVREEDYEAWLHGDKNSDGLAKCDFRVQHWLMCLRQAGLLSGRDRRYGAAGSLGRSIRLPQHIEMGKALRLITSEEEITASTGYLQWYPLAARIASLVSQGKWSHELKQIQQAGECWAFVPEYPEGHTRGGSCRGSRCTQSPEMEKAPNTQNGLRETLVVFIGGCTESEIAAVRALSNDEERFVILTTGVITGHSFIESFQMDWQNS